MPIPDILSELIERCDRNLDAYKSGRYNEAQVRREFIDPFFKALGWDMDNERGHAERYKEVIHEDAIRIDGAVKAPDYCFRIGDSRKFFVEAKKPSVDVKHDTHPAFQLRRYAWSAKLPLSILTDFEELAVYDCRVEPNLKDKASKARVMYVTFREYAERWDEIESRFSRDAILKGAFDRYISTTKKLRGTASVDDAFLAEIEDWRISLASNLALRNAELTQRDLNFAVQATIDRIIFLRICEDRGIENYGRLKALTNGPKVYERLVELLHQADQRFNSGLFYFKREKGRGEPDTLTPGLTIDDKVLKGIISRLYYPESPYEFSVLPVEILGHTYEQFLGKVIRLTKGHRAKIEEKPEVRKAGGVYYTPTYIVDYIVQQTVGKLLEDRKITGISSKKNPPRMSKPLRVLDPACGSGSFLLGAYQHLLDWHLEHYTTQDPKRWAKHGNPPLYQTDGGDWRLTIAERKRILTEHLFGVDIDPQAVEVTKLSLLLKVLEGESSHSLGAHLWYEKERALPDLSGNIKCGNSLIAPDFWQGQQRGIFDEDDRHRVNTFDWRAEFAESMGALGFDAVIGNPPYIRMEAFKELKAYLRDRYRVHDERSDLYVYFIEREHELLRDGGMFGMIVSNKFVRANYGNKLRRMLSEDATIHRIVDFAGLPVFKGATVRTIVLITSKELSATVAVYSPPPDLDTFMCLSGGSLTVEAAIRPLEYQLPPESFSETGWNLAEPKQTAVIEQLRTIGRPLLQVANGQICRGVVSGLTKAFVISAEQRNAIVQDNPDADEIIHPFLQGRFIRRYKIEPSDQFLIYTHHGIDVRPFPAVVKHLRPFKSRLEARATKQAWYELQQPQFAYRGMFEQPKIVFPDIATGCRFAIDRDAHYGANTVYFLPLDDLALLGLLNSRIAHFYFAHVCAALEGPGEAYLRFFGQYLEGLPVALPDNSDPARARLASLVERMLELHDRLAVENTAHARNTIQREIEVTDRAIDQYLYELYGLTDEEVRLIEDSLGTN